jgi:hypothetical protein
MIAVFVAQLNEGLTKRYSASAREAQAEDSERYGASAVAAVDFSLVRQTCHVSRVEDMVFGGLRLR